MTEVITKAIITEVPRHPRVQIVAIIDDIGKSAKKIFIAHKAMIMNGVFADNIQFQGSNSFFSFLKLENEIAIIKVKENKRFFFLLEI